MLYVYYNILNKYNEQALVGISLHTVAVGFPKSSQNGIPGVFLGFFAEAPADVQTRVGGAPGAEEIFLCAIGPRVHVDQPIILESSPRMVVLFGEESQATVLLEVQSAEKCVLTVRACAGSQGEIVSLHASGGEGEMQISYEGQVEENAQLSWRLATFADGTVSHALRSTVAEVHGESSIDWAFLAHGQDRFNLSAENVFLAADGSGEITMKGVAEEQAFAKAHGKIEIGAGGAGTETYLTQSVLMLDPSAKVDVVPGLEIKTNDVKASHSASVARVTPEDLFYFAARGISERDARQMFIEGFLGSLIAKIAPENIRNRLAAALEDKWEYNAKL